MTHLDHDEVDQQVKTWMLERFNTRNQPPKWGTDRRSDDVKHLVDCSSTRVADAQAYDGEYGCETGCEYGRLECDIVCDHGKKADFYYGDFGDVGEILADILKGEVSG